MIQKLFRCIKGDWGEFQGLNNCCIENMDNFLDLFDVIVMSEVIYSD